MVNLRCIRQARGMTQKQLAEASGVPRVCIARYESGRHYPSMRNAERIASVLGCAIEELIGGEHDTVSNDPAGGGSAERVG